MRKLFIDEYKLVNTKGKKRRTVIFIYTIGNCFR